MITLWIGIGLLSLLAIGLLVWPLRRAAGLRETQLAFESEDRYNVENVAIYRQRLQAMEVMLANGELERGRFEKDRLELKRRLLEDTQHRHERPLEMHMAGRWLLPVVALCVVMGGLALYDHFGARGDLALFEVVQSLRDASFEHRQSALEAEAEHQPNNPNVWAELFPLYRDSGQYAKAADVVETLIGLEGRQPWLLAQLAQAEFFAAHRTLTDRVQGLVDETLALDPRQPTVNDILGIEAFDHARYGEAIDFWRKALAGYDDPEAIQALQRVIGIAQQRMADNRGSMIQSGLDVEVTLDPRLANRLPGDASVFLVARDSHEDGPPLAVTRTTVSALPRVLTLSDANAMTDKAKLSQADRVDLIVRVSASGQAKPQAGDLYGRLNDVAVSTSDKLSLVIDHVVPAS